MVSGCRVQLGVFAAATLLYAAPLAAQTSSVGGLGVVTTFEGDLGGSGRYAGIGVEACLGCQRGLGLFVDYQHLHLAEPVRPGFHRYTRLELVGFGLHKQRRSGAVRLFFGFGGAVGHYWHASQPARSLGVAGLVGRTGVTVPLGRQGYLRPYVRLDWLSIYDVGLGAGIAAGVRF